jgi:hypothetical protein
MFRALFADPQEALHMRQLVYCVRVVSWMHQDWSGRIKGLCMFRALLADPQEVLHKRQLVYCARVMSVGCTRIGVEELRASTCFEHYLLILRRCYTNGSWYIACVLSFGCTRIGVEELRASTCFEHYFGVSDLVLMFPLLL